MKRNIQTVIALSIMYFILTILGAQKTSSAALNTAQELEMEPDAQFFDRTTVIATMLGMDDETAAKFWPIYETYQDELRIERESLIVLIDGYVSGPRRHG